MNYNYQIIIEYDGLNFVGWQYQKNGVSIQEIIERSLKKIFKKKIRVIGSGRTDKGVHAIAQSARLGLIQSRLNLHRASDIFLGVEEKFGFGNISRVDLYDERLSYIDLAERLSKQVPGP